MDNLFENNEFDKKIKERYVQYSVDPDRNIWNDIDSKLLARKLARSRQRIRIVKAASIVLGLAFISLLGKQLFFSENSAPVKLDSTSAQVDITDESSTIRNKKDEMIALSPESEPDKIEYKTYSPISPFNSSDHQVPIETNRIDPSLATKESIKIVDNGDATAYLENIEKKEEFIIPRRLQSEIVDGSILSVLNLDSIPIDQSSIIPEKLKETSSKLINRWVLDIYGAPILTSRFISVNQEFAPKSSLDKSYFNSGENSQLGWSLGITAGYKLSPRLLIKSGLDITTQKLKFQTKGNNLVPVSDSDFLLYTSFGGILLTLEGDQINLESILKTSVLLKYISLPVGIEYKVIPNTSVALDLDIKYLFSQGINWESSEDNDNGQSIKGIQGVRSTNVGFSIGIVREQQLFKNVSLLINPVFRSNLTTINNSAPVKAFPNSFGIRFGIRKYLGPTKY